MPGNRVYYLHLYLYGILNMTAGLIVFDSNTVFTGYTYDFRMDERHLVVAFHIWFRLNCIFEHACLSWRWVLPLPLLIYSFYLAPRRWFLSWRAILVDSLEYYRVPFFGRLANSFVDDEWGALSICCAAHIIIISPYVKCIFSFCRFTDTLHISLLFFV